MTATKVFIRFLKEEGYHRYAEEIAVRNIEMCSRRSDMRKENFSKIKKENFKKNFVEIVLKSYRQSLSAIFYYIILPNNIADERTKLCAKFWNFLKNNINGNYLKQMIPNFIEEKDAYRYRNGYHELEFSLKKERKVLS